jgi:isocitrate dehydrogenase kinase/phosphatase
VSEWRAVGKGRRSTPSSLANLGAEIIRTAFGRYRRAFRRATRRAQVTFERRDWGKVRDQGADRLRLYRTQVDACEREIRALLGTQVDDRFLWVGLKAVYSGLIAGRDDWDLGETFLNSISRRVFSTVGVDSLIEFVDSDFGQPPRPPRGQPWREYGPSQSVAELVEAVLGDRTWGVPILDPAVDGALAAPRMEEALAVADLDAASTRAEVLEPIFYRGKGAFLVGRLVDSAERVVPLVLALESRPEGIRLDAALLHEAAVSVLFSFTRWYFQADSPRPFEVVRFLKQLLPRKRIAELYISLGHVKHGKTELYRELLHHLQTSGERFHCAPGTPGLVMVVFTLPGLDVVLKVIRDRFPPEKKVTRAIVRERYRLVHLHDRAGRLVDAQEFELLRFDRSLFEEELLEELLTSCSRTVGLEDGKVVVGHAYVERKVAPLDLFVREAPDGEARAAVVEYGHALRDLAASGIFPGDLLLKNFGVTRHGRIAFYDYDELLALREVRFRDFPEADEPWQEMAAEPWYSVEPGDVFPEEFRAFLGLRPELRQLFEEHHSELFTADWWRGVQGRLAGGWIAGFAPYPDDLKLRL